MYLALWACKSLFNLDLTKEIIIIIKRKVNDKEDLNRYFAKENGQMANS